MFNFKEIGRPYSDPTSAMKEEWTRLVPIISESISKKDVSEIIENCDSVNELLEEITNLVIEKCEYEIPTVLADSVSFSILNNVVDNQIMECIMNEMVNLVPVDGNSGDKLGRAALKLSQKRGLSGNQLHVVNTKKILGSKVNMSKFEKMIDGVNSESDSKFKYFVTSNPESLVIYKEGGKVSEQYLLNMINNKKVPSSTEAIVLTQQQAQELVSNAANREYVKNQLSSLGKDRATGFNAKRNLIGKRLGN
jgi:hypothetical protein